MTCVGTDFDYCYFKIKFNLIKATMPLYKRENCLQILGHSMWRPMPPPPPPFMRYREIVDGGGFKMSFLRGSIMYVGTSDISKTSLFFWLEKCVSSLCSFFQRANIYNLLCLNAWDAGIKWKGPIKWKGQVTEFLNYIPFQKGYLLLDRK